MKVINKYFPGLSDLQLQQFNSLEDQYRQWNSRINVISRKDLDHFEIHHVLHSLSIAACYSFTDGLEVMDLGTGGGFPGVPLAIYFPNVHFHLVDSTQKKIKVVDHIIKALEIKNVTTQHARAEEIKDKQFDVVVSRAVAPLIDLWKWSAPLIKKADAYGGSQPSGFISLKGGDLNEEISESSIRPTIYEIEKIFKEPYFFQKYILHVGM